MCCLRLCQTSTTRRQIRLAVYAYLQLKPLGIRPTLAGKETISPASIRQGEIVNSHTRLGVMSAQVPLQIDRLVFIFQITTAERALDDPVDDHGHEEDGETTQDTRAFGSELQRLKDLLAQTAPADQRDDHHHR